MKMGRVAQAFFHPSFFILLPVLFLCGCDQSSSSSNYPNRTIVLICPWAAGGGTDRIARIIADRMEHELGKPVVVQNQTGGSGVTGHSAGAMARPDGYTLTLGTFELITFKPLGISDLTAADFQPLEQVNADPAAIIVGKDAPWQNLQQFLDAAKSQPGKLKISGTAAGGVWDLARTGLLQKAGLPQSALLWVPSQGAAPALVELLGGHIEAVACSLPEARSQIEAGEVRALCVMSKQRVESFPNVPTASEQGVDYTAEVFRGVMGPKGLPDDIVQRLSATLDHVVKSPEFIDFMKQNGFGVEARGPADFKEFLDRQAEQWTQVIKASGLGGQD